MGDLAAFPTKIAGAAVEVIKLPELIHKVKKIGLEMGESACSGDFLGVTEAGLPGLKLPPSTAH